MEKLVWLDLCKVVGARRCDESEMGQRGTKKIEIGLDGWAWTGLDGFILFC